MNESMRFGEKTKIELMFCNANEFIRKINVKFSRRLIIVIFTSGQLRLFRLKWSNGIFKTYFGSYSHARCVRFIKYSQIIWNEIFCRAKCSDRTKLRTILLQNYSASSSCSVFTSVIPEIKKFPYFLLLISSFYFSLSLLGQRSIPSSDTGDKIFGLKLEF